MKNKLILFILLSSGLLAQEQGGFSFKDIGSWWIPKFYPFANSTSLTDSTNYVNLNKGLQVRDSMRVGRWLFVGTINGGLYLDTNRQGELSYTGNKLVLYNRKDNATNNYVAGEKNSLHTFSKFQGGAIIDIATIDTAIGYEQLLGNIQVDGGTQQIKHSQDTATDFDSDDDADLNRQFGKVTTKALTTAANGVYTITVNNSLVATTTAISGCSLDYGTNTTDGAYITRARAQSGSIAFIIFNGGTGALNGTLIIQYHINNKP